VFNFLRKSRTWKQYFEEGTAYGVASDFKRAEESFRQAIRLAPSEPYPHYELGYTLSLLGKHKEALEEFEATDRLARGFFLTQTEAYLSRQAVSGAIDSEVLGKLRWLQRLMDTNAKGEETLAVSQQVVAMAPTCALGYFHLGKSLLGRDQAAAEQALHKCIRLGPDDTTAINAKFHLGILKRDAGEEEVARRIWSGIVEAYPGNPHTKFAEMMSAGKTA
jgi:Flp pilus assembly protein TadD